MRRLPSSLLVIACLTILALGFSLGSSADVRQPVPTGPVSTHPEGHEGWLQSQQQTSKAEDRIKATVDTYYRLKYDSWLEETVYDFGFLFCTDDQNGRDTYAYERGRLQYLLAGWQLHDTLLKSYDYAPVYERVDVQGNRATVVVRPRARLAFRDTPERTDEYGTEPHQLVLARRNGRWLIQREEYSDELAPVLPCGTDFDELTRTLPGRVQAAADYGAALTHKLRNNPRAADRFGGTTDDATIQGYIYPNRPATRWYALQYTNNNGDCSTTNYNSLFVNYAGSCNDCQNFVSQCIWYGFGGSNTSQAINGHWLPMVDGIGGATDWWADSSTTGTNWKWTYVPGFIDMIEDNWSNDKVGVHGTQGGVSATWQGDFIAMTDESHVFIINDIIDYDGDGMTDYNEIYVSAHTYNRRNVRLSSLVSDSSRVKFMWIFKFKNP